VLASAEMREVARAAARAGASNAKVLITGESGVGKDVIARYIHANSPRRNRPYVAVNCAGVVETLLESELFGHAKGSFTGAYRDKQGKLQLANGGTLFLDEVGEMSLRMQALLLRFLENGEIQAVGSESSTAVVNVRVIAATNRNLTQMVAAGLFREDLLYRLRVVHLHIPALRERRDDIKPLAAHFLDQLGEARRPTDEAWRALERYHWPGNVRELHNVVEQMVCMSNPGEPLGLAEVPENVKAEPVVPLVEERRRQVSEDLYHAIVTAGYSFWDHIHPLFLNRDITRHDLRELIRRGLTVTCGNYRALLTLFGLPATDYKRFLNFLASHDCRVDYRPFRSASGEINRRPPPLFPPMPMPSSDRRTDAPVDCELQRAS
jgi:transcriptional regulator with PAS, ATPase and Fis domain